MLRLSLVLMLFMGSPARAGESFFTGNTLLSLCNDNGSDVNWGRCSGYVEGISDSFSGGGNISGWKACLSGNITSDQIRDIVVRFLVNHPEKRHYAASGLVAAALEEAFPCP